MTRTNVLLLSNLDSELNDPYFRLGAYKTYLHAIATSLQRQPDFDVRFLLNKHIFSSLKQSSSSVRADNVFMSSPSDPERQRLGAFITDSYKGLSQDREEQSIAYLTGLLGEWRPDAIICWEAPTSLLRTAYPDAAVVDLMPSMFARPPYPRAIAIDPVGLYENCWFSPQNLTEPLQAGSSKTTITEELRGVYTEHFKSLDCRRHFEELLSVRQNQTTSLVPLQISGYFGFRDNCRFQNQFEFLEEAARNSTDDVILCTQYVGGFISERALTDENLRYLRENVADVRYDRKLETIDSVSQFMVPWVDRVYSVSSTLGLQAKFLGKTLISPSTSHLRYLADEIDTKGTRPSYKHDADAFMEVYLSRGVLIFDRITTEASYFAEILRDIIRRKNNHARGGEVLPGADIVDNTAEKFLAYTKFGPSERNFKKLFPSAVPAAFHHFPNNFQSSIDSEAVSVISFDIFDTLVRRTVYKPEDVFAIMQKRLDTEYKDSFPPHVIVRFAELRQAAERLTRQGRDAQLLQDKSSLPEEITIEEVYTSFAACVGQPSLDISALIKLEQDIELSVLRPRAIGKLMYEYAQAAGRRIVVTSDFIHPESFVRQVLTQCGYVGFEHLFLSSSLGTKKHSGELFEEVIRTTGVAPSAILHIGDNPVGDVQKARDKSLRAIMVPSARALAKEGLLERDVKEGALDKSFYLRTIMGLFANTYLHTNTPRQSLTVGGNGTPDFQLISTSEEFGFLVIGPIALAFSEWIVDQAVSKGCTQIIFFARDCYLPFQMAKKICNARGLDGISLVYAPTSRKSVTGLDMYVPEDVLKVRIDDFTASGTLGRLLEERFLINSEEIPANLLKKWNVKNLAVEKRHQTTAAIYGLALDIARSAWEKLLPRYEARRRDFKQYLTEHATVDFGAPTVAVDFGYQGSIHRKVAALFDRPFTPLFFMTYSDGFGGSPLENAEAFYVANSNPMTKSNVAVTHNLLLETLMNEGIGSAIELVKLPDGSIEIIRDSSVTPEHSLAISSIHRGALKLCDQWLIECGPLYPLARAERDSLLYFFSMVAKAPTRTELELLGDLIFDNGYAGVKATALVANKDSKKPNTRILWPEAELLLKRNGPAKTSSKDTTLPATQASPSPVQNAKMAIVRPFVAKIGNRQDVREFNADPAGFFAKLRNPWYRGVGTVLFPSKR
ncbi:FMN phosphatase YigB (HAD superfamily) [Rhizobium petrolearium]|uniref:HAD family hydrolase n=1 Tax=Neorhizobium petrolearium TaxID=515361 RepID=UPI001AE2ADEE|nr:HAD family hydrolase [Neorhizobium petrolearium]MBP1842020.1 FMN phosphatase YigB (HAD superfamily) [Neorhizobium petrolearium]